MSVPESPLAPWLGFDHLAWGWDGSDATADAVPVFALVDGIDALTATYDEDAHAPGYILRPAEGRPVPPVLSQPRVNGPSLGALAALGLVPAMSWVFVDIDNPGHEPWESLEAAREAVAGIFDRPHPILETAGAYTTRAGLRLVWRLPEPIPGAEPNTPGGILTVRAYRSWAEQFHDALSKATGIPVVRRPKRGDAPAPTVGPGGIDATCAEWGRCYRLPFVIRRYRAKTPGAPDVRPPERLRPYVDLSRVMAGTLDWRPPRALTEAPLPRPRTGETTAHGAPPFPSRDDVPQADWSAVAASKTAGDYYLALADGRPLARRGARQTTMTRLAGAILGALPYPTAPTDADPAGELARRAWNVMARAVASDPDDDSPTLDDLWGLLQRFAARRADDTVVTSMAKASPPIGFTPTGKNYIWNEFTDGYMPPVANVAIVHGLENYCPTMGLYTRTPTGGPRDTASLLASYGQPIRRVVVALGAARSRFDVETGTMYESTRGRLTVKPRYDAQVDAWLRLFFGLGVGGTGEATSNAGLDWVATLGRLDLPSAALYIHGKKGVGKGMFAAACAAYWGAEMPCPFADAFGAFNEALTGCPVVWLDEGVSAQNLAKLGISSAEFRAHISARERPIRRKHLPTAESVGCTRTIITANNRNALPFNDQHTADDIDAIAERILYVRCADGTAEYLAGPCGGPEGTKDWVMSRRTLPNGHPDPTDPGRPGRILEHFAWLEDNRTVIPGARFLVPGTMSEYHTDIAANNHATRDVLAAIAHAFDRPAPLEGIWPDQDCRKARRESRTPGAPTTVHVNVQGLRNNWAMLAKGVMTPTESDITRVLMALARGPETRIDVGTAATGRKQKRAWPIPVEAVLRIAEQFQIGDLDELRERMAAGAGWGERSSAPSGNAPPVVR